MFILKFSRIKNIAKIITMKGVRNKNRKNNESKQHSIVCFIFSLAIVFLIAFLIISNLRIHQRRANLQSQVEKKEVEIKELSEKIKDIEELNKDSFDDDFQLEKIAREQLLLKKEGEEVIFVTVSEEKEEETKQKKEKNLIDSIKNFSASIFSKIVGLFQ